MSWPMTWIVAQRAPQKHPRICLRCHRRFESAYPSLLVCEPCREEIRSAIVENRDYDELGCGD
jgi:hypothetical protein